jgi:hypothetical protein
MGKKTPKAPDPVATSAAQTGTNIATATANTYAQNGNITTDDGTRTTTFRNQDIYDPFTKQTYKGVIPDVVETLSPAQKAIKDQQDQASLGLSTLANRQTGKMSGYLDKPFTFDDQAHTKWATDLYGKLNNPQFADEQQQAQSRLSNMGIKMGNPAYDREISRLERSQGHQRDQFLLDSYGQDFATQQALRNQPINEITALMSGGQVSQPVFNGAGVSSIPTTDNAGIINQNYANQVAAADKRNAGIGSVLSGIGSAFALSDETTKKNIKKVGTVNGQAWHEFNYKGEPRGAPIRMGLMAGKVARKTPEAVITGPHGKKMVNYSRALHMGA